MKSKDKSVKTERGQTCLTFYRVYSDRNWEENSQEYTQDGGLL